MLRCFLFLITIVQIQNVAKMPVNHRFLQHEFGNGFATHNAVLDRTPYAPEVLFVGTYNPTTDAVNSADFFYGRKTSWFWPTMKNIFVHGNVIQFNQRKLIQKGPPPVLIDPPLSEVFNLCSNTRMGFADLIKGTLHNGNPAYQLRENIATYQGVDYDLTDDNALAKLSALGQVEWSTEDIIDYLRITPSIYCVRLTRQPDKIWQRQWKQIVGANYGREMNFGTIHTPSGQGLRERGIQQATALARRWLFHRVDHKRLCDRWIQDHHVQVQNLNYSTPPLPLF